MAMLKVLRQERFTDEVRAACRQVGNGALAERTGIDPAAISRFRSGQRGLRVENLDRVAEALNLHVVVVDDVR